MGCSAGHASLQPQLPSHRCQRRKPKLARWHDQQRRRAFNGPEPRYRGQRRFRYYFTQAGVDRKLPADGWRIPAADIEKAVINKLQSWLVQSAKLLDVLGPTDPTASAVAVAASLSASITTMTSADRRGLLLEHDAQVTTRQDAILMSLNRIKVLGTLGITLTDGEKIISLTVLGTSARRSDARQPDRES